MVKGKGRGSLPLTRGLIENWKYGVMNSMKFVTMTCGLWGIDLKLFVFQTGIFKSKLYWNESKAETERKRQNI